LVSTEKISIESFYIIASYSDCIFINLKTFSFSISAFGGDDLQASVEKLGEAAFGSRGFS